MRFKAQVDFWLAAIMYGTILMFVPILFFVEESELIILLGAMLLLSIIIIPIVRIAYYELREDHIFCRIGYIAVKIKYEKIREFEAVDTFLTNSGLALSRHRIKIRTEGKVAALNTTFISPENRELFMLELKNRCKHLNQKEY